MKYNGRAAVAAGVLLQSSDEAQQATRATSGTWLGENSPGAGVARAADHYYFLLIARGAPKRRASPYRIGSRLHLGAGSRPPRAARRQLTAAAPALTLARPPPRGGAVADPARPASAARRSAARPAEASARIWRPRRRYHLRDVSHHAMTFTSWKLNDELFRFSLTNMVLACQIW